MDDNVFVISHPSYLPPPFSTLWLSLHFPPASSLQRSAFSLHPFSPFVSSPFGLLLSLSIFLTGCTNSWWESSKWNSAVASFNSTALVILNFTACQDKTALSGSVFFFFHLHSRGTLWYYFVTSSLQNPIGFGRILYLKSVKSSAITFSICSFFKLPGIISLWKRKTGIDSEWHSVRDVSGGNRVQRRISICFSKED